MKRSSVTSVALLLSLSIASVAASAQKTPVHDRVLPGRAALISPSMGMNCPYSAMHFCASPERPRSRERLKKEKGLGPTFNGDACVMCHAQPTASGNGVGLKAPEEPHPNPQVALATLDGATNIVPSFITSRSPVLVARFVRKPDGSPDGDVHTVYTIAGRTDAKGCDLKQPDFSQQMADNNIVFRIPTPMFGLGLVENTPDATLRANLASTSAARSKLGIGGIFNISPNDGSIMRFGWKAQNTALLIAAAEAANVEEGISNELFPNERDAVPGCIFNATPEDSSNILNPNAQSPNFGTSAGTVSEMSSDIINFAAFIRFLAPPKRARSTPSTESGETLFNQAGCALCHSPMLRTAASKYIATSEVTYHPYSDFALHHMGAGLADGISQLAAGPDEFRTAPLWGVGQRLFFLHDGRTSDLLQAIEDHSADDKCQAPQEVQPVHHYKSEADAVIRNFKALSPSQIQDILNFLRSL